MNTLHDRQSQREDDVSRRPSLRLVERQPQVHKGRVFAIAMVIVFLALLGNAVLSSILVTNQKHLDGVTADVAEERAEQERLRVELAELKSPKRITEEAEKMGMIRPDSGDINYLGVPDEEDEPAVDDDGYHEDAASSSGAGSKDKAGR